MCNITYEEAMKMDFNSWMEVVQGIHRAVIEIELENSPTHQILLKQIATLDKLRGILSIFKTANDMQFVSVDDICSKIKKESSEGKNDAERTANAISKCKSYSASIEQMKRVFLRTVDKPVILDLIEIQTRLEQKKSILGNIYALIAYKDHSLENHSLLVKDMYAVARFGKPSQDPVQNEQVNQ